MVVMAPTRRNAFSVALACSTTAAAAAAAEASFLHCSNGRRSQAPAYLPEEAPSVYPTATNPKRRSLLLWAAASKRRETSPLPDEDDFDFESKNNGSFNSDLRQDLLRDEDGGPIGGGQYQQDELFLRRELARVESLDEILTELEQFDAANELEQYDSTEEDNEEAVEDMGDNEEGDLESPGMFWDAESLNELLGSLAEEDQDAAAASAEETDLNLRDKQQPQRDRGGKGKDPFAGLENALQQGVVPVNAGIGDESLPGDFGFDPLDLSTKDYFRQIQTFLLNLLPAGDKMYGGGEKKEEEEEEEDIGTIRQQQKDLPRPRALILRDYREAEIRHSRLAMLAAVVWPLQEMLDRLVLPPEKFGPLVYGPVTLPYFPLGMTVVLLLLGYLDIYSQSIKDVDRIGEAFLPGDCFWDPLRVLQGAPDSMIRRMQERELFNGRAAMLAVLAFVFEETVSHKAVIELESNAILFQPAYQVPFVQRWLDAQFSVLDSSSTGGNLEDLAGVITDVTMIATSTITAALQ